MMRAVGWWKGAAISAAAIGLVACGGSEREAVAPAPAAPSTAPLAAGAEPSATASADPAPPPAAAPASKRAALRFETGDDDFPAPLVDVTVNGQPTSMIVDTGATHQVVGAWIAEQIGPTKTSNDVGLDHAGKRIALTTLPGASIVVSGWGSIDASNAVVAAIPEPLRRQGIGGVLSPQALAADGRAIVLDFRKRTMHEAPLADALKALEGEAGSAITGDVRSCGAGAGSLLFVRASIGGVEVDAQVDTGATQTTVRAGSDVAKGLAPKAKGATHAVAASGVFTVKAVDGARVKVGGLEVETSIGLVPKDARPVCPNDALVGMDVFRPCVIVIGKSGVSAKCSAPPR